MGKRGADERGACARADERGVPHTVHAAGLAAEVVDQVPVQFNLIRLADSLGGGHRLGMHCAFILLSTVACPFVPLSTVACHDVRRPTTWSPSNS